VRVQDQRVASDWRTRILHPPARIVAAAILLFAVDQLAYQQVGTFVPLQGPLDWIEQLLTILFIAWALPALIDRRRILAALVMSVAIDADHIPGYLGSHILTAGLPRPYTHSLATVFVLLVLAAVRPGWRGWASGAAMGVLSHLWRDLAEPQRSAVALFWPLSDRVFRTSAALYFGSIAVLAVSALIRARRADIRSRTAHVPLSGSARR
jgi:membrane-bound metal-dependent hydrolase YbcI (DUF457 family)